MMTLFLSLGLLFFISSDFIGIFLFLGMFIYFFFHYSLIGLEGVKGDLYGILGADFISLYLFMLLMWLSSLVLTLFYSYLLSVLTLFLIFGMSIMFVSLNMLFLFIYFEFSMIPMFIIIMFMGISKERYTAVMYMFIYTMVGSLPMLVCILLLFGISGSLSIDYMMYSLIDLDFWVKFIIIFMFLIKVPMFMVHIWLPKAHVEAPVFGSMILASVMLKMGGYGIIRSMDFMELGCLINDFFFSLCLCGGLLISFFCLYHVDMKILVAYSSVIHMGMMLMGFFSSSEMGYLGGVIMMFSHGICSSGMFYLVNEIYKVSGSRLLLLNKGVMGGAPILAWMWLILLIDNLGAPPCFGILSELMLMGGCLGYSFFLFCFYVIILFFVSCFVMNMFGLLMAGFFSYKFSNIDLIVYYGVISHLLPLNFLVVFLASCF